MVTPLNVRLIAKRYAGLRLCLGVILYSLSSPASTSGNFPQSKNCPDEKPFHSICTHSLHNLEGWYGQCRKTRAEAQQDADQHVEKFHNSNSRWTGVRQGAAR